ncbi:MAG: hypothetical protein L6R42_007117 [Xanthoria sp. 1 TBL-2021]|nr:MAG: hypothetical protein L6R42_007117 [Xanthoria sp. 1 TBL-2021]
MTGVGSDLDMSQGGSVDPDQKKEVIGSSSNFWIWSRDAGWDLTHPSSLEAEPLRSRLLLDCEISNVAIDPAKTALLIIDMQNFLMCKALRVDTAVPAMLQAQNASVHYGIPAARQTDIQIIWLNWGLTDRDLQTMPPAMLRVFGWQANSEAVDYGISARIAAANGRNDFISCGEISRGTGLGADLGKVVLEDGTSVDAGRVLMKDAWNARLHGPLAAAYEEGRRAYRPDVLIHKNRNSGLWDPSSGATEYLRKEGIRTLLFAGANIDQCVMGTLQDALSAGFDIILLKDGCATDSPNYAQQSAEFNCCRNLGFLSTCKALAHAGSRCQR